MGRWSALKRRIWRPTELRFEVQFETPVIFVCPPTNTKGPIKNKPIHFVDGTPLSLEQTLSLLPHDQEAVRHSFQQSGVHAADNELASWVTLLSQLQLMEKESREWQYYYSNHGLPHDVPLVDFQSHTLAVAVQAKKRSWDTMPSSVKKPYATTAMCHLLEIAAMMGIYWKEFDRAHDRYRAEGNGYILTGSNVADLGIMFTLQIYGKSRFEDNRVIPVDEVKELCYGFVSTLFQSHVRDRRRIEFPNEDLKDLSFLQLGSLDEIAETMVLIECNTDTANYFRSDDTKHSHLFPLPFELLGMLGKTLRIRNSAFRMLPNPTPYHWDKNVFNIRSLVMEYEKKISDSDTDLPCGPQIEALVEHATTLVHALRKDKHSNTPGYSMPLLDTLHGVLDKCDEFLMEVDRDLVRMVVREHFQEVLKLINDKSGADGDDDTKSTYSMGKLRAEHFDELTAASPELRQEAFMDLYFFKVLAQVRERAVMSYRRHRTTPYRSSSIVGTFEGNSLSPSVTPSQLVSPLLSIQPPVRFPRSDDGDDAIMTLESQVSAIWCTLVLRMLCWLLLHDFNKKDVQIPKSELMGSRLPVYIA
ncbi:hypothetical protein C8A05DRAFT_40811 [Staphylotrichum tortipilum]|uniref:Uncharacterized protein n=1 Tax=Staphylotrichum tortipilum TaxID=2831512 RepID=A0AAN6MTI9_9PEZI|nr:hypothetical protein C8A05DRAFT_40811 [Staphylotrichum longicolle]